MGPFPAADRRKFWRYKMQPTLCSRCKKNVAVVFISKMDGEKTVNEGLCLKCAKDLGLPQVDEMMKRMGISDEDLETLNSEMLQAMNGVENIEDLPGGEEGDEEEEGKIGRASCRERV